MKRLACIAFVLAGTPLVANAGGEVAAKAASESFPVSGQIKLGYRTPHSSFMPTESGVSFGSCSLRLGISVFYTPPVVPKLTLSAGFGFSRAVHETYNRAQPQVQPKQTQLSDLSLGANWNFLKLGPVTFTAGLGGSLGVSNTARSTGRVASVSPSLAVTYKTPFGLIANLSGSLGFNFNENPTVQVDEGASDIARISGTDTGQANAAGSTGWSAGLNYQIIPGLFVNGSYFMDKGYSAVEGTDDEATSPVAQTGLQGSVGHGTAFSVRYQIKRLGGGAADTFNDAAKSKAKGEDSWTDHVALSLGMMTRNRIQNPDNASISNPFFDSASNLHGRTVYALTLTGML